MNCEQEDIDQAAEHQHQLEQREQQENSGVMDPRCFTRPLGALPRLTPKEQFDVQMAQLKALNFALDKIFGVK